MTYALPHGVPAVWDSCWTNQHDFLVYTCELDVLVISLMEGGELGSIRQPERRKNYDYPLSRDAMCAL